MSTESKITKAICAIMGKVKPVEKRGRNDFQKYDYATAADVLHQLHPLLSEHGLAIFHTEFEREELDGGALAVTYEFTLAHESGEVWPMTFRQTGMAQCRNSKGGFDDKASNKCLTAAMKYFLVTLFKIPTGDFPEADSDDADREPSKAPIAKTTAKRAPGKTEQTPEDRAHRMCAAVDKCDTPDALEKLKARADFAAAFNELPDEQQEMVRTAMMARRDVLYNQTA